MHIKKQYQGLNRQTDIESLSDIIFQSIPVSISFLISFILGVQLCFRRFHIDGFSGKWWSK